MSHQSFISTKVHLNFIQICSIYLRNKQFNSQKNEGTKHNTYIFLDLLQTLVYDTNIISIYRYKVCYHIFYILILYLIII